MKIQTFKTALIILLLGFSQIVSGQSDGTTQGVGVIKGNLVDSLTGQPLEYVAIALKRGNFTKIINGAITDEKGNFRLEGIGIGLYKLIFSFIGYETKTVNKIEITATKAEYHAKNIFLKPSTSTLGEVVVTTQKQLIEQRVDRLVYNVEKDVSASTQSLNDILRKVPMLSVDAEGKPSLKGNANVQVLINGKPSGIFSANIADALRTIPADQVARVEVLTSVSAKYDAEGTAGIINIITKKKQIEGYNGSVNIAAGHLMGNSSVNVNARMAKFGINASLSSSALFPRIVNNKMFRRDNLGDSERRFEQIGTANIHRYSSMGQLGFDYDFNSQNSLTTTFRLAQTNLVGVGSMDAINTTTNKGKQIIDRFVRDMNNQKKDKNIDWVTDYKRTFKNPKNELNASFQWSHFVNNGDYFIDEKIYPTEQRSIQEKGVNKGSVDELTGQIDATKDLGKQMTLEIGAKNIYRQIGSLSDYMEYSRLREDYVKNDIRSNDFNYRQNVSAVYAQTNFAVKNQWNFQVGSRLENTFIQSLDANRKPTDNNYLNLTPSVSAAYTLKNGANMKFSYNRRIQRPGLTQLNPFVNSVDPRNLTQGNISLKPEIADKFELNYSRSFGKGFFLWNANYDLTDGLIERLLRVSPQGVSLSTFQNVGQAKTFGSTVFISVQLTSVWSIKNGVNLSKYVVKGDESTGNLTNKGVLFESFFMSNVSLKNGLNVEAMVNYNAPTYTIQGKTQDMFIMTLAAKMDVLKKKGAISLTATNPFCRTLTYSTALTGANFEQMRQATTPFRTVNIGFNYRFGKTGKLSKRKKSIDNDDVKKGEKDGF